MKLSKKLEALLSSDNVRLPLATEMKISYSTFNRWYYNDQEKFATLKNIAAIEKITGLKQEEMFEKEEANA